MVDFSQPSGIHNTTDSIVERRFQFLASRNVGSDDARSWRHLDDQPSLCSVLCLITPDDKILREQVDLTQSIVR